MIRFWRSKVIIQSHSRLLRSDLVTTISHEWLEQPTDNNNNNNLACIAPVYQRLQRCWWPGLPSWCV